MNLRKTIANITEKQLRQIIKESIQEVLDDKNSTFYPNYLNTIDWNAIPKEEYIKQYVSLRLTESIVYYGRLSNVSETKIFENQETTVPFNELDHELRAKYGFQEWQIREVNGRNGISLILIVANIGDNVSLIDDDMRRLGWFRSYITRTVVQYGTQYLALQYEPLYQDNINDIVRGKMPFIYHWTPWANVFSIKEQGFIPHSSNDTFIHPERIYFVKYGTTIQETLNIMFQTVKPELKENYYCMFILDVKKIPKNVSFFPDPRYESGIFTQDKVPYDSVVSHDTWGLKEQKWMGANFVPQN